MLLEDTMMRAFLSGPSTGYVMQEAVAAMAHEAAEREARAILAESEPLTWDRAGCCQTDVYSARTIRTMAQPGSLVANAGRALAESLAAFIEERS